MAMAMIGALVLVTSANRDKTIIAASYLTFIGASLWASTYEAFASIGYWWYMGAASYFLFISLFIDKPILSSLFCAEVLFLFLVFCEFYTATTHAKVGIGADLYFYEHYTAVLSLIFITQLLVSDDRIDNYLRNLGGYIRRLLPKEQA